MIDSPTITSRILIGLDEYFSNQGGQLAQAAARFDIDVKLANHADSFIDLKSVISLFEAAAADFDDDAFGLHFAKFSPMGSIGFLYYVTRNAPALRDALSTRVRFFKLHISGIEVTFKEHGDYGTYAWQIPENLYPCQQFMDFAVALLMAQIRILLADPNWRPADVTFQHPEPKSLDVFVRCFGSKMRFDTLQTSMVFDKASLDRPLPAADAGLFKELQLAASKLPHAPTKIETIAEKVQKLIASAFPSDGDSKQQIARELGMSLRTLQRALADENTTFETIRDVARKNAAETYLTSTNLPLTEIAFLLGFSELSAFSRAARGWFGEPASSLRQRAKMTAQKQDSSDKD